MMAAIIIIVVVVNVVDVGANSLMMDETNRRAIIIEEA